MNKPDKAGEPSMEEILASIRQIIADEPGMDRGTASAAPNPLAPRAPAPDRARPGPAPREARSQPLLDRLNGVLKSPQPSPTGPLGSKRPVPFDQDLADMLDDEGADDRTANPAPKPDIRVAPELVTPAAAKTQSPPSPSEETAKPAFDGAAAMPPQLAPSAPTTTTATTTVSPSPFDTAEAVPEPPPPPPPQTFGFPPLRKQGFYPPQSATPPRRPPQAQDPVLDGADVSPEPVRPPQPSPAPSTFGAVPLSSPMTRSPGVEARAADGVPYAGAGAPLDPGDLPLVEAVAATAAAGTKPLAESPAPVLPADDPPIEVQPLAGQPAGGAETFSGSGPRFPAGADTAAAAQALDALAQGLAASAAASAFSGGMPPPSAAPEAEARSTTFSAPVALTPAVAPPRTLEDAVAEMLRPMLQQWVADNMPRIIERALRAEAVRPTKPGSNSP